MTKTPTRAVIVDRLAVQMVDDSIGRCHRQALWCGHHNCVWPHGQDEGCNDYVTALTAAVALIASGEQEVAGG